LASIKQLETIERLRQEKFKQTHKLINGIDHKFCSQHGTFFPEESPWMPSITEYFYINKSNGIDGLNTWCKKCSIEKASKRQLNHLEEARVANKNYVANPKYRENIRKRHKNIEIKVEKESGLDVIQKAQDSMELIDNKIKNMKYLKKSGYLVNYILIIHVLIVVFLLNNITLLG